MTLEELAKARGSTYKPFPPKNAYFTFDFSNYRQPTADNIYSAIKQTVEQMLNPPIKNLGTKGIAKAGSQIKKWENRFTDQDFRMSLFNVYLFITVGGTGGGLFRYMYGRFLKEASKITSNGELADIGDDIKQCGDMWAELAAPLKGALDCENPAPLLKNIPEKLNTIADREEDAFKRLKDIL
jgi:hypothetical protein